MPVDANSDADARRRPCVGVVLASVLGVSFLVGASQTAEASSPPERASTPPSVISTATLHVRSLDDGELRRHLSLRSRGLEFVDAAAGSPAPAAVLVVRPVDDGYALTVVLADGRAFDRRVAAAGEQAPRIVASALANLLAAIEEARVTADRSAVDPSQEVASLAATELDPREELEPGLEPFPEEAPGLAPELEPEPPVESEPELEAKTSPAERGSVEAPWRLATSLAPHGLLQLPAERGLSPFGGAGLGVGLAAQTPRGLRFGLDLRGHWRRAPSVTLHRYRVGLHGGYGLDRGRFQVAVDAFVAVEPWQLRSGDARLPLAADASGGDEPPTVALAGGLRLTPALVLPAGRRPLRLRFAVTSELAYAGVPVDGLRAVYVRDVALEAPEFRVGGLELSLGALVGVDFELRRR